MDFTRHKIQKKLSYLSRSSKNFHCFSQLLVEKGLVRQTDIQKIRVDRQQTSNFEALYLQLLQYGPLDLYDFLDCLQNSQNGHLLPCFLASPQDILPPPPPPQEHQKDQSAEADTSSPTSKPKSNYKSLQRLLKRFTQKFSFNESNPKPHQNQQAQNISVEEDIFYSLIGTPQQIKHFTSLPTQAPNLTTIKLRFVSMNASNFFSCVSKCQNLEFLQLDRIQLGKFNVVNKPILPKLTEYQFHMVESSTDMDHWTDCMFFNIIPGQKWSTECIFKHRLNITVKINRKTAISVDHDHRKCVVTSPPSKLSETLAYFNGYDANRFPFDYVALSGMLLENLSFDFLARISTLNLSRIQVDSREFGQSLQRMGCLKRLCISDSKDLVLDFNSLPQGIKSLCLSIREFTGAGFLEVSQQFEMDSILFHNTILDRKVFQHLTKMFKSSRIALGGKLSRNHEDAEIVQLIKHLLTTLYESLEWFMLYDFDVFKMSEENQILLQILGISDNSPTLFEFDYQSRQLEGRVISAEEKGRFVAEMSGTNDFYDYS